MLCRVVCSTVQNGMNTPTPGDDMPKNIVNSDVIIKTSYGPMRIAAGSQIVIGEGAEIVSDVTVAINGQYHILEEGDKISVVVAKPHPLEEQLKGPEEPGPDEEQLSDDDDFGSYDVEDDGEYDGDAYDEEDDAEEA